MGSTLPLLVTHHVRAMKNTGESVSWLYFVNTLGAAAGCARLLGLDEQSVDSRFKAMVFEFSRTLSRLTEMQTKDYMSAGRIRPG